MNILIADDDSLVLDVVEADLLTLGHTIAGRARDGAQALALVGERHPDLVLMDIEMPGMDGIAATEQIMATCPVPVVMLSVYADKPTLQRATAAGAGAYVTKPTEPRALDRAMLLAQARMSDLIELRRVNRDLQEALAHVRTLKSLLPICACCKQIRDDEGYWQQIETYISAHTDTQFSHGLCPTCVERLYPDNLR